MHARADALGAAPGRLPPGPRRRHVFPRQTAPDGDDIIGADPCVGDRDARSEDRQLLLDALLAADRPPRHHLQRPRRAHQRAAAAGGPARRAARRRRSHRPVAADLPDDGSPPRARERSSPSTRCSRSTCATSWPARSSLERPWSFDAAALGGAQALVGNRSTAHAVPRRSAAARWTPSSIELDDLVRFVQHPVKAFLRQRLGIAVSDVEEEPEDALPIELDALERWTVGERLLDGPARRASISTPPSPPRPSAASCLPDVLASRVLDEVSRPSRTSWRAVRHRHRRDRRSALGRGRRRPQRRPGGRRHRPGVVGDVLRTGDLLPGRRRSTAWRRGCGSWRSPPRPRSGLPRRHGGTRKGRRVRRGLSSPAFAPMRSRDDGSRCDAPARARRPLRQRHARTAAAVLQDLRRVHVRETREPGEQGPRRVGDGRELRPRGSGARAPARARAHRAVRRAAAGRANAPTRTGPSWPTDEPTPLGSLARAALGRAAGVEDRGATGDQRRRPFDVCGPLPSGVTVLEASAGTGKTFTIAALAARYVAEGTPLEQLLLVTFTPDGHRRAAGAGPRAARHRRARAARAARTAASAGGRTTSSRSSPLLRDDELALRRRRLAAGARRLRRRHHRDHARLLPAGARRPRRRRRRRARRHVRRGPRPTWSTRSSTTSTSAASADARAAAVRPRARPCASARIAVANPRRTLVPAGADRTQLEPAMRCASGRSRARARSSAASGAARVLTYDDLLTRLATRCPIRHHGPRACATSARALPVALVDEFQDTDPIQWEILRRAFGGGELDARAHRRSEAGRSTRFRGRRRLRLPRAAGSGRHASDAGGELAQRPGADRRLRRAVRRRPARATRASCTAPCAPPTPTRQPRLLRRAGPRAAAGADRRTAATASSALTPKGWMNEASGRRHDRRRPRRRRRPAPVLGRRDGHPPPTAVPSSVPSRCGRAIWRCWSPRNAHGRAGPRGARRGRRPGGDQRRRQRLRTPAAGEWLAPARGARTAGVAPPACSAAALTVFLGWTAEQVATADDAAWEQVCTRSSTTGPACSAAAASPRCSRRSPTPRVCRARVLARARGERELTDLRHVGQLLHLEATAEQLGATALTAWLRQRIAEARRGQRNEDRSRRLDSDAEAVQVLTIHRSKGLEFPIVYCPFLWEAGWIIDRTSRRCSTTPRPTTSDDRRRQANGPDFARPAGSTSPRSAARSSASLYVALTRARHQAVVWWASSWDSRSSPLARLLFAPEPRATPRQSCRVRPTRTKSIARLRRSPRPSAGLHQQSSGPTGGDGRAVGRRRRRPGRARAYALRPHTRRAAGAGRRTAASLARVHERAR